MIIGWCISGYEKFKELRSESKEDKTHLHNMFKIGAFISMQTWHKFEETSKFAVNDGNNHLFQKAVVLTNSILESEDGWQK